MFFPGFLVSLELVVFARVCYFGSWASTGLGRVGSGLGFVLGCGIW